MTRQLDPTIRRMALTFAAQLTALADEYVARQEAVRTIGLAALCREHALLIGPPGTAKTSLLERFSELIHAEHFTYLLTRYTEPAELFGAIDVRSFQRDGVYRVNTEGMLPRAEVAFLDEVFNGSSAILNSLLTLINERTFHNGSQVEKTPLITLFGASNEMPEDSLLLAFCDRFLFRCRLDYVPDDAVEDVLKMGWETERKLIGVGDGQRLADADGFALADLKALQQAVVEIDLSRVRDDLTKILLSFREEAINFSDRRVVKAQKAIAASALLDGRGHAELDDLSVIVSLWTSPYDEAAIRRVVEGHGVPLDAGGQAVRSLEEIRHQASEIDRDVESLTAREECREMLRRLGRLLAETRASYPEAFDVLRSVQGTQKKILDILRDRFREDGDLYV